MAASPAVRQVSDSGAGNDSRIALAWCDDTPGQQEIYLQTFDADGQARGAAVRVTDNATESLIPAIRRSGAGFVLAWNECTPGPDGAHDPRGRSEIHTTFIGEP